MTKKILIFSSRYGSGHVMATQTVLAELEKRGMQDQVRVVDFGELIGGFGDRFTRWLYPFTAQYAPWSYRSFVAFTNSPSVLDFNARWSVNARKRLEKIIEAEQPEKILATFCVQNHILSLAKENRNFELSTLITDLTTIHAYWIAPEVDKYMIGLPEMRGVLKTQGVPDEKIVLTGYPTRAQFFVEKERKETCEKLGLADKFTILYMVHTAQDRFTPELASVLESNPEWQSVIICGRNHKLAKQLSKKLKRTKICEFVENIDEYMRAANVVIGKAGGGFVMEAAALGKPLIITSFIDPQERGNVELSTNYGWGFYEPELARIIARVSKIEELPPEEYQALCEKARSMNPTYAGEKIVDALLS